MSNSFSELFRPTTLKQLIGKSQKDIATSLLRRAKDGTFPREILLTGPSGTGKTTIARMFFSTVLGEEEPDYYTLNCGANTGINEIRYLIDMMQWLPLGATYSAFYLDEIHGLSKDAQRALLTEIEPVPSHVILVASTTEPDSLRKELKDRFTNFILTPPSESELRKKAGWIAGKYGRELPSNILDEVIAMTGGSVRVLDKKIQEYFEGSYTGSELNENDPNSLVSVLFYQSPTVSKVFASVEKETEYIGSCVGLCNYSIKVLSNPKPQPELFRRAQIILTIMGEGLGRDMPAKVVFHRKLLQVLAEFSNNGTR